MSQLAFEWQPHASYAPEDFIISASNEAAAAFLERWPDSSGTIALLYGGHASGKTHLTHRWMAKVEGRLLYKSALGISTSEEIWPDDVPAVLEDIETIKDEAALFHLLRHAETSGKILLLTANVSPKQLPFTLPDLRSRLLAMPEVNIGNPDEFLLEMFIVKYFSDRQQRVQSAVVQYIIKRVERSFAAVLDIINRIEETHLETNREITVQLVSKIMGGGS